MAGGTFKAQNKVRPGAYINFKGVPKPLSSLGIRGVVTFPTPMSWGAEITELSSMDLLDGKSLAKIGYSAFDEEAQIYREALKGANKAIIYRLDRDGVVAQGVEGNLTAKALYAGVVGNDIWLSIKALGDKFEVVTNYKQNEVDKQIAENVEELEDNAWVEFSGTGAISAKARLELSGGTNGSIDDEYYADYLNAVKSYKWNVMGIPQNTSSVVSSIVSYIENMRDNLGKKVQAVLYNADANSEGIISVNQGYKTVVETVSPETFVAYVAGLTAGSDVDTSNTYHVLQGAISIVYPSGVTPYGDEEIEEMLKQGKLVLSTRQDGAIVIEQDINTLHDFTPEKGYAFSKNRVIRVLDEINNSISLLFEKSYIGKVDNNDDGRNIFKADVISYLNMLQNINAIQNFNSGEDIEIYAGQDIDSVVVDLGIQPVDSMEKLYMTVMVG